MRTRTVVMVLLAILCFASVALGAEMLVLGQEYPLIRFAVLPPGSDCGGYVAQIIPVRSSTFPGGEPFIFIRIQLPDKSQLAELNEIATPGKFRTIIDDTKVVPTITYARGVPYSSLEPRYLIRANEVDVGEMEHCFP
jgi:hypothetical protein